MKPYTHCPNCQLSLKPNIFTTISLLASNQTELINYFLNQNAEAYCQKCVGTKLDEAFRLYKAEKENTETKLKELISCIPIITIPSPNWEYDILDIITAQSVTGTGVMTELATSFTDLFGSQSKSFSTIIKTGENICFSQLRKRTLDLGGNAIIGTDIDYSEVGGTKGMLMVCMAGTAIKINNLQVLGSTRSQNIKDLTNINQQLNNLQKFSNTTNII